MKKIKELFLLLCETGILIGQAGLLTYGFDRYAKMGVIPCGITFAIAFLVVYRFSRKKKSEE